MQWIGSREVGSLLANAPELPPPPTDWVAQAYAMIFEDPNNRADLASYISTVSYHKASLTGDIFGPFTTNAKRPDGSWDLGEATGRIVAAAQAAGGVQGIKNFCVIFTDHPGPSWAFWAPSGGGSCYVDMRSGLGVIAMENLHVIAAFGDLYGIPDSPGAFDVMDCACGTHPSAFTKIELGWLSPKAVVTIPPGTLSKSVTLHALGSPLALAPTPDRAHAIVAPVVPGLQYYIAEARLRVDKYEQNTPNVSSGIPQEGVVIYLIDRSTWPPVHKRRVLSHTGQNFSDKANGFSVTVKQVVSLGITVEIDRTEPADCAQIRSELAQNRAAIQELQSQLDAIPVVGGISIKFPPKLDDPSILKKIELVKAIKNLRIIEQRLIGRAQQLGCAL
jgi:hypothetical protein